MKRQKRIYAVLVWFFICLFLLQIGYAWLTRDTSSTNRAAISDFELESHICFVKGSGQENTADMQSIISAQPAGNGGALVEVNLTDSTAYNYIGNLRVAVRWKGVSPSYLRVRILEQWTEDDEFIPAGFTPYTIAQPDGLLYYEEKGLETAPVLTGESGWLDNRKQDFCYYYTSPVYPPFVEEEKFQGDLWLLLINGISEENIHKMTNRRDTVKMNLIIQADAVQPNRFREFWKIDALPWQ